VGSLAGKLWNLPNTVLGLIYGSVGHLIGLVAFHAGWRRSRPVMRLRDNALQFLHNPFGGVGALTLGNTTTYNGDPYDPRDPLWYPPRLYPNGADPRTVENGHSIAEHELQHTLQGEHLGLAYLPSNLLGGALAVLAGQGWHGDLNWNERGPRLNPPRPWARRDER
jgi:hypothetical protein